jgi:transcriptional regulator with XRE-family HTH domain
MCDRTYANVSEMIRDLTDDEEAIEAVDQALARQWIMGRLMATRAANGLSQGDIAVKMECSQSRVSKMENSADDDLRYGDMREYAELVDCTLISAVLPKNMSPVDEIKCLAAAINHKLSRMADLAQKDKLIANGVTKFFIEAFVNFSMIVSKAASTLPMNPDGSPRIEINFGVEPREKSDCHQAIYPPENSASQHRVAS